MPRKTSENLACKELIDQHLEKAGCYLLRDYSKIKIGILVDGYDAEPRIGLAD